MLTMYWRCVVDVGVDVVDIDVIGEFGVVVDVGVFVLILFRLVSMSTLLLMLVLFLLMLVFSLVLPVLIVLLMLLFT